MSETIELPADKLGEHLREEALLDCEINVSAPEGADVDEWTTLKEAEFRNVEYADDDLHGWFETETRIAEMVARATHLQPAEYKNHYCRTHVSIVWDFDPESQPVVDVEVEHP